MKQLLVSLALIFFLNSFGQSADDYLIKGIEKHNSKDYEGAINEYDKAIQVDMNFAAGYYNRGVCKQALKDLNSAKKDFDKTIELDSKFIKAYYSRASIFVSQENYKEALPDLDKIIKLNPAFPNALTLRGQIKAQIGNKKDACEDFNKAKKNGDKNADKYLSQFCVNEQPKGESLSLYWPDSENWKIGKKQMSEKMTTIELIPSNETFENWTEIITMLTVKGLNNIPMDEAMNMMFGVAKKNHPNPKLTFIEKNENVEYPWILFTMEFPNFKDEKKSESQLWFIIRGKSSLYSNFRAIKKSQLPTDLKDKWIEFFKTAQVVYQ